MLQMTHTANSFNWSENSIDRNQLSFKYEPLQPLLLLEIMDDIKAEYFFDIGSNIGLYTILMSLSKNISHIYSYEPAKDTYLELEANIRLNDLSKIATPYCLGVSSKDGTSHFQIESSLSGINSIVDTSFHDKNLFHDIVEIKTIALDNFYHFTSKNLAFKIDVEGHEYDVILGAQKLFSTNNCILQIEIMPDNLKQCRNILSSLGYTEIFTIKNDHYFTNIAYSSQIVHIFEKASEHLVDLLRAQWPNHTKNDLIRYEIIKNNNITINVNISMSIFKNPEFAFYIYQDKQLAKKIMYQGSSSIDINLHEISKYKELSVTIFVRSKENYSIMAKKHMTIQL